MYLSIDNRPPAPNSKNKRKGIKRLSILTTAVFNSLSSLSFGSLWNPKSSPSKLISVICRFFLDFPFDYLLLVLIFYFWSVPKIFLIVLSLFCFFVRFFFSIFVWVFEIWIYEELGWCQTMLFLCLVIEKIFESKGKGKRKVGNSLCRDGLMGFWFWALKFWFPFLFHISSAAE